MSNGRASNWNRIALVSGIGRNIGGMLVLAVAVALAPQTCGAVSGSGGNTTNTYTLDGTNYVAHIFTSNGSFTVSGGSLVCDVLVVGGGGGGGSLIGGGGGGAGGLILISNLTLSASGSYAVTVGAGGGAQVDGGYSQFTNVTLAVGWKALGGGSGRGRDGASTGGGSGAGGSENQAIPPAGTVGQGHDGGYSINYHFGGGGGGAGLAGSGKNGGAGKNLNVDGTLYYFAAGGGGGDGYFQANEAGVGAKSGGVGGGDGGNYNGTPSYNGGAATTYGSGGGGGCRYSGSVGGAGYQGIVVVQYRFVSGGGPVLMVE